MKKLFGLLSACLLSLCLLVSCGSKMGAVTKALEGAEYTVTAETIEDEESPVKSMAVISKKALGIDVPVGFLMELGSTKDIDEAIEELKKDPVNKAYLEKYGKEAKDIHAKLEEAGLVNNNVILVTVDEEAIKVFKNA